MSKDEKAQPSRGSIARRWWEDLQDTREGSPNPKRDRAALARLRRAAAPLQALEEPAVFDLYRRLGFGKERSHLERHLPRVTVVAAVLAHIRQDAGRGETGFRRRFAEMLGQGDPPVMSALRFKRLLSADADQEMLVQFRRAVALAGHRNVDVGDVAAGLLGWDDQKVRVRWAFDYHGAGIAAPANPHVSPSVSGD
jgi:CRISPR type I-E-associated protein CasB/Cse2